MLRSWVRVRGRRSVVRQGGWQNIRTHTPRPCPKVELLKGCLRAMKCLELETPLVSHTLTEPSPQGSFHPAIPLHHTYLYLE